MRIFLFGLFLFMVALPAFAGESLFGYLYTTDTTPEGHFELEQWITDREGQAAGRFHHVHFNSEVEYGVTDKFQVALYGNFMLDNDSGNSVRGLTEGIEIPYDHDPTQPFKRFRFDSISAEFLYRFLSPYTDPVGFAVYLEPEAGPLDVGLEFRTILQKNFLEDTLVVAFNAWIEFENEKGSNLVSPGDEETPDGKPAKATMLEGDLGVSYRVAPKWFVGLEFRNHSEFQGWGLTDQDHTAFFIGPTVHYATEKWFLTFSALRQIAAIPMNDEQRAQMKGNRLFGDEHTAWDGIQLKVGVPL